MSKHAITYEGQTLDELRQDFEGAVEDYLASCAERGVEPCKPYSGTFNVRVSPEIHSAIAAMAQQAGVTINAFVHKRDGSFCVLLCTIFPIYIVF